MAKLDSKAKSKKKTEKKSESKSTEKKKSAVSTRKKAVSSTSKIKKVDKDSVKKDDNSTDHVKTPQTKGLSLGAKLSITIALVSAILTLVVGFIIASMTKSYISEEIIKSGINSVKFLSSQGSTLVNNHYTGEEKNVIRFKETVQKYLAESNLSDLLQANHGKQSTILDGYITMSEVNGGKPELIFSLKKKESSGSSVFTPTRQIYPKDPKESSNMIISEAILEKNNFKYDVYSFEMNLNIDVSHLYQASNFRPEKGKAYLFLSAAKVAEAQSAVYKMTAFILAISVLVSVVIAYFLSQSITSPILQLVKDMSVVQKGDLDHITHAHSSDEVGYLSNTFNQVTKSLKIAHQAEIAKEKLEHDLSVGREIQQTLLPKSLDKIKGYDSDAYYLSAKEVGGDYYDLIRVDKKKSKLGIVVADVSGKGIQGAMIMTIMRTIMNIAATGMGCLDCLCKTNKFLTPKIKRGMFVTAFYVVLDYANHKMRFCSAGHNAMVIYRAKTKEIELLNPTGIALGFDKGPLFERTLKEGETTLESGDRFVLYTDGVVESMNEAREEFTDDKFFKFVKKNATLSSKAFVQKLVVALKRHQGKAEQHDDITIVTFKKT